MLIMAQEIYKNGSIHVRIFICVYAYLNAYIYAAHLNRFDSCQNGIEDYTSAELVIYLVFVKCLSDGQEKMH